MPFGEVEAGRAFGMSRGLILRRVTLPKAFRIALPAYTNEVIFLFQATSLVSIITMMDLTGVGRVITAESFRTFEVWIFVGLCYLACPTASSTCSSAWNTACPAICGQVPRWRPRPPRKRSRSAETAAPGRQTDLARGGT